MRADSSYGVWVRTKQGTYRRKKTHDSNLVFWLLGALALAVVAGSMLDDSLMDKAEKHGYTPVTINKEPPEETSYFPEQVDAMYALNAIACKPECDQKHAMTDAERGRAIADALSIDLTKPVELVLEDGRRQ